MADETPAAPQPTWLQRRRGTPAVILALSGALMLSCTGEGLRRLEMDLAALRERLQAREEVRIHVAGPTPTTTSGQLASPTEPHVTLGAPPCPPAVVVPARASPPPGRSSARRPPRRGRR